MPRPLHVGLILGALVAAIASVVQADAPHVYAITGARVVTVAGQPIASGTVVIRDGRIESVGAEVAVPDEALVIDGTGLTVYPGLIDMGNSSVVELSTPPEPRDAGTREEVERWKRDVMLRPQIASADHLTLEAGAATQAAAGITTVLATPPGEIVRGHSAIINVAPTAIDPQVGRLAIHPAGQVVLKSPVALHVAFPSRPRGRAYPQSLMGVMAFVRQSLMDAQHYGLAVGRYESDPTSTPRPSYDPALEALQPAVEKRVPVAFEANTVREIVRALDIAREIDLRPIIAGGLEADRAIGELKEGNVPVLYSLDYPTRSKGLAPDADEPLRVLRQRANAPKVPATLAREGVTFAFASFGLNDGTAFVKNAVKAVAAGLSAEAAIRALTLDAATIAGVDDRLGSIETGKIANLIVTDGDLFDEDTSVTHVFIDGQKIAIGNPIDASAQRESSGQPTQTPLPRLDASPTGQPSQSGQSGPTPSAGATFAVRGATVFTITNGTLDAGTVLVRDGRIAAVGTNVEIPPGVEVVDASGRFVTPGIIDAHSHIAAESINESGTTVSSMTGIEDVLDTTDVNIFRDLAGGVTTANVLHGSANPIGGLNAVIKLRWGKARAKELLFEGAMPGIKFALGENPKDMRPGPGQPARYPRTRPGVEFVIRDAFTRAKAYQQTWQEYERRRQAGDDVMAPRRDLQLEPLVEILEGTRLVHAHSYRADEILMLLRVAEEMGFTIATLQHVLEGYKVANEIAAHGAGASTFSDWWGYKVEAIDAIPYNATLMLRKGVLVSINSDSAEHARRLNTEAAKSIKWGGLTDDEAIGLVTINPAQQLRIDDRVGSIEVGKDADLAIWTHHPLSSYAIVDRTYIDGVLYYDRRVEEERLTQRQEEKASLARAERPATPDTPATTPEATTATIGPRPRVASRPDMEDTTGTNGTNGNNGDNGDNGTNAAVGQLLAITNARIVPVTQPVIERGIVLIRDGRIEAVGADVIVPPEAEVIDADGSEVYPGWINPWTAIGLSDPGAGGYADTSEMLDFNPHLRPRVAFHSDSDAIPIARSNGITTVGVTPSGGVLSGQIAVMNLDGWTWEENTVEPVVGISFQFPAIGRSGPAFGPGPPPGRQKAYEELEKEQKAKLDRVVRVLDRARAYGLTPAASRQTDWMLESLIPIVEGRLPLFVTARTEQQIRGAVAFSDRTGVRIVINDGLEAPLVATLLREKQIPVILGPVLTLPTREDMWHAESYMAAGKLFDAGVLFAFSTGPRGAAGAPEPSGRTLPYQAAQSVAWGLPRDEALKALTINAAQILGVDDRLGSIEPGKMANLLIARGDPLEVRTEITHVIINGRNVGVDNRQLALYERYRQRP